MTAFDLALAFTESDKKRFHEQYTPVTESGCWLWNGGDARGYGQFWAQRRTITAHVFSWIAHYGPIQKGLFVCHKCDVKLCCNPSHLFLGTHEQNMRDGVKKKRFQLHPGELSPVAKLTNDEVRQIKKMVKNGSRTGEVANKYKVSPATISMIKHGKRWAQI